MSSSAVSIRQALCCGCGACEAVCPRQAIGMQRDSHGFLCPVLAAEKCIGCGRCVSVCPMEAVRRYDE